MTLSIILACFIAWEVAALASIPNVLLRRQGHPVSASGWVIALVTLPGIALAAWWIFGRTRLEKRLRKRTLSHQYDKGESRLDELCEVNLFDHLIPERAVCRFAFSTMGNRIRLLPNRTGAFPVFEEEIRGAKQSIHLFYYTFVPDETGRRICELLVERAKSGVTVRVAVDGFGTQGDVKELRQLLEPHGIEFSVFLPRAFRPSHIPRTNFVNHRKVTVIDERIAFTGGMNIGEEYEHRWQDLMVRLEGPVVAALSRVFAEDWHFSTSEVLPITEGEYVEKFDDGVPATLVASGPDTESWIHDAYFAAITGAKERVWITTPYLLPTAELSQAMRTAAGRGVDVRILVPRGSDVHIVSLAAQSYYSRLLNEGVKIFEYVPSMMHGKAMIFDSQCVVGTANIDSRSMRLSFELCCFVDDPGLLSDLTAWMEKLFNESEQVTRQDLENTKTSRRVLQAAAHVFAPLL